MTVVIHPKNLYFDSKNTFFMSEVVLRFPPQMPFKTNIKNSLARLFLLFAANFGLARLFLKIASESDLLSVAFLVWLGLLGRALQPTCKTSVVPQGPCHIKNNTIILIHYGGGKKNTTVVKQYGSVSETPCFPGENSQEISTNSEWIRR